ncbi:MAG: Si-specific NAD(P)(+) transhydrogenase, partial [Gemmatimonadota bacterium]
SGPAGQKAAIQAAKLGKRVAIVDRKDVVGGVCVHTGTIPSKTMREAILYFSGFRQRMFYGKDFAVKDVVSMEDLAFRVRAVMAREVEVIRAQLKRNHVTLLCGGARFVGPNTVVVDTGTGLPPERLEGDHVLIACGTRPAHHADIPIDGVHVLDSDQVLQLSQIPRELIVVGGGVVGLEYASMFSALGVKVTVVEKRPLLLEFADQELVEGLCYVMRNQGAIFRLGEAVEAVETDPRGRVVARLESGKQVRGDVLLYTVGRQTNADLLGLDSIGLGTDSRGRIKVNEHGQTDIPHIYAAGDVIGFPALASTSMEQGRRASCHMFGVTGNGSRPVFPYGIYTVPEISMVGATEQELTASKTPYEVGQARFVELAKAQMMGVETGLLKILFHRDTLKILGVHAFGENAAEIIHIGQVAMELRGTIEYFRDASFNYPTLAEAYKVAGLDGCNRL